MPANEAATPVSRSSTATVAVPAAAAPSIGSAVPAADAIAAQTAPVVRIPADTVVTLETTEPLTSATLKRGDKFGLRLAQALTVDGATMVPAGAVAVGEVVHAERSRSGGKPGELLLAARYIEHAGLRLPLRGFRIGAAGVDKSGKVAGLAVLIGGFAMFVRGGEIEIPAFTQAAAKTAQAVDIADPAMHSSRPETASATAAENSISAPSASNEEVR